MKMHIAGIVSFLSLAACGGEVIDSTEMKSARDAYAQTSAGAGQQFAAPAVIEAKTALDDADAVQKDKGSESAEAKDAAYVATRKAQLAEAQGRSVKLAKDIEATKAGKEASRDSELAATKTKLALTETEKAAADKKQAQAMADLKAIKDSAVKNESRGMVITLSGGVLFKTAESKLTTGALIDLNKVADALTSTAPEQAIVVEGHTDNQGVAGKNMTLSQDRAQSVVDYLISRGVAKDRISAKGIGDTRPVSDNKTTEGRAQNRRVEIIVGNPSR